MSPTVTFEKFVGHVMMFGRDGEMSSKIAWSGENFIMYRCTKHIVPANHSNQCHSIIMSYGRIWYHDNGAMDWRHLGTPD
jgi:hypothetical protein